jgi:hypothetical protein
MTSLALIHPDETRQVSIEHLILKCTSFKSNPALIRSPYRVQSSVPLSVFQDFISAFEGNALQITLANFLGLSRLCEEFGFCDLSAKLTGFEQSLEQRDMRDAAARAQICVLEEQFLLSEKRIEALESQLKRERTLHREAIESLKRVEADLARLASEVAALRSSGVSVKQSGAATAAAAPPPEVRISDVEVGEVIDTGNWATVSRGSLPGSPPIEVALKVIRLDEVSVSSGQAVLPVWTKLRHPALLPILAWSADAKEIRILSPFAKRSLQQTIESAKEGRPEAG